MKTTDTCGPELLSRAVRMADSITYAVITQICKAIAFYFRCMLRAVGSYFIFFFVATFLEVF